MDDFASVVKKARQDKRLTLESLALKLGSHKGYCSGIENRKVNPPSSKIVRKMAKIFGLDVKRLLILAEIEKIDREVREIFREGALGLYEARLKGNVIAKPAAQVAVG